MISPILSWRFTAISAVCAALLCGCSASKNRDEQLTKVARDWCMTIRASQVMPVYPLTEDMLPGDIYLTSTPIGEEQRYFREKGFLPFDNFLARLGSEPAIAKQLEVIYGKFFRNPAATPPGTFPSASDWPGMPIAGFPSYNVEVSRGGGINTAIPVQGIPLGLSLIGASSASASVTLKNAYTYGLDIRRMNEAVDAWATDDVKKFLAPYGQPLARKPTDTANYIRVISRVFFVKKVNVTILSTDSFGAGAQFGGAGAPSGPIVTDKSAAESADSAINKINENLQKSSTTELNPAAPAAGAPKVLPSGSVRIVQAEKRSVSLDEEFARPLVIGYLGFDRQILPEGKLGPPIHTLLRVQGAPLNRPDGLFAPDDSTDALETWYRANPGARVIEIRKWMDRNGIQGTPVTDFLYGPQFAEQRAKAAKELINPAG